MRVLAFKNGKNCSSKICTLFKNPKIAKISYFGNEKIYRKNSNGF